MIILICSRCGMTAAQAFNLAMLRALGCSTSRDPMLCDDGGAEKEHTFESPKS